MRNLMFVFDRMPDQDGCTFVEVENESGESINAGEWRLRDDGLAELVVPVNYTAQSELAALREELAKVTEQSEWRREMAESNCKQNDAQVVVSHGLQQRLTAAEQRNAELVELLKRVDMTPLDSWYSSGLNVEVFKAIQPTESGASE